MNIVRLNRKLSMLNKVLIVFVSCQLMVLDPLALFAESIAYSRPEQKTYSLKGLFAKLKGEKREDQRIYVSKNETVSSDETETETINAPSSPDDADLGGLEKNSQKSSGFQSTQRIDPETEEKPESTLPAAVISLGGRTSADDSDAFVDVLAPVIGKDSQFLFINPRATLAEESANEQNVGAGIRRIVLDDHLIVGGNIFYDTRESERGFHYEQLGLGLELLTDWVDARANYYLPNNDGDRNAFETLDTQDVAISIQNAVSNPFFTQHEVRQTITRTQTTTTTDHHFDKFESAMQGADAEVGVKIPVISNIAETRVFGGYYFYNSNYGKDIQGFKARLEVRAVPALIFDAEWYEDKELHGTDYYVGARARLPFDVGNLITGKNPFEGTRDYFSRGPVPLKSRMTDMVMRDVDIILEESDFIEDLKRLTVTTTVDVKVKNVTLMDDITFVNGNNKGSENGTFEHPFDSIQEGVDEAFGDKFVYVGFAEDYKENVVLREGVTLWGSGYVIFGIEDGINGVRPTVNGQSLGPAITMADNTRVWGFHVINQDLGGPAQLRNVADQVYDISRVGIYAENKTNLEISSNNLFEANSVSILLASENQPEFGSVIAGNSFQFNDNGIKIFGKGPSGGTMSTVIDDNELTSTGVGIEINTKNYDTIAELIQNNNASNTSVGLRILNQTAPGGFNATLIQNNTFNDNEGSNMEVTITGDGGLVGLIIQNNQANRSINLLGLEVKGGLIGGTGIFGGLILGNVMNDNAAENIKVELSSDGGLLGVIIQGNEAEQSTGSNGIVAVMTSSGGAPMGVGIIDNEADGNNGFNIFTKLDATAGGIAEVIIAGNQASGSSVLGILLEVNSLGGPSDLYALLDSNVANNNQNENIKVDLEIDTGTIIADIFSNEASNSFANEGIVVLGDVNTSGDIDTIIDGNTASNNMGTNIFQSLTVNDGDAFTQVLNNNASGSITNFGINLNQVILSGTGLVQADIINNIANNNQSTNINGNFISINDDVDIVVEDNEANGSVSGMGINLNQVVSSGIGAVIFSITDNTVSSNSGTNINVNAISSDAAVVSNVSNNEANGSLTGSGIILNEVVSTGTGSVVSTIADNVADSNNLANINGNFISSNDSVVVSVSNNEASNSVTGQGILLNEVVSTGTGSVVSTIAENTANNNTLDNINSNFTASNGSVVFTAQDNQANDGDVIGMVLTASVSGNGDVTANVLNNTVSGNNGFANILMNLTSNAADLDVTISGNQASLGSTLGILLDGQANTSGNVNVNALDNTATGNNNENIKLDLSAVTGDITITVTGNEASDSIASNGIDITATSVNVGSAVNANISDNIAVGNQGVNINTVLTSIGDDLNVTISGNTANDSDTSFGLRTVLTAVTSGNVNATFQGNTMNDNGFLGSILDSFSDDDISINLIGNTANGNTFTGMEWKADAGGDAGDEVNIFGEDNVAKNNGDHGIVINAAAGTPTYNLDFGGGTLSSTGGNSTASNTGIGINNQGSGTLEAGNAIGNASFWDDDGDTVGNNPPNAGSDYNGTVNATVGLAVDPHP